MTLSWGSAEGAANSSSDIFVSLAATTWMGLEGRNHSVGAAWAALGYKRGTDYYSYRVKNEEFLYVKQFQNGVCGTFIYVNPILVIPLICKELYRLEVNIRNLEKEKQTDYYKEILGF